MTGGATKPFATGRCQCGAVTFSIAGPPVTMGHCHCKDCQRVSGAGHLSNARFRSEDVTLKGATATYAVKADSGNTATRHFCPTCGSRLFSENSARPGFMNFHVGTFDDTTWFAPQWVIYTDRRAAWDTTTDAVPNYPGMMPIPPPQK